MPTADRCLPSGAAAPVPPRTAARVALRESTGRVLPHGATASVGLSGAAARVLLRGVARVALDGAARMVVPHGAAARVALNGAAAQVRPHGVAGIAAPGNAGRLGLRAAPTRDGLPGIVARIVLHGAAALALLAGAPRPAAAWSEHGHAVVGYVAERLLSAAALAEVRALVAPAGLQQVAGWADEVRHARPATAPLHYVNIDIHAAGYVAAEDCAAGACVVAAIPFHAGRVADRRLPRLERQEALKFLVHFTGDIHQPLHAGDNADRGGNLVKVRLAHRPERSLHAVWDDATVDALGPDVAAIGATLLRRARALSPAARRAMAAGTSVEWAAGSWAISRDTLYPGVPGGPPPPGGTGDQFIELPADYPARQQAVVADQLLRAGMRLAAVLNASLAAKAR